MTDQAILAWGFIASIIAPMGMMLAISTIKLIHDIRKARKQP